MSLDFLNLPDVLFRRSVDFLTVPQILEISLTSTKAATQIKGATKIGKRGLKMKVNIGRHEQSIKVYAGLETFEWTFFNEKLRRTFRDHAEADYRELIETSFKRGAQFTEIASRLLWLFERAPKKIKVDVSSNFHLIDVLKNVTMDSLLLHGKMEPRKLRLWKKFFSLENSMTIRESLHINVENSKVLKNLYFLGRRFPVDELTVERGAWFDAKLFHHCFSARNYTLFETKLESKDVNGIVKKWMSSEIDFSTLDVRPGLQHRLEYDEVLKDVEHKDWDEKERAESYPWANAAINMSKARDIVRPSDGNLASILITRYSLYMIVWHERFPDITNRDVFSYN